MRRTPRDKWTARADEQLRRDHDERERRRRLVDRRAALSDDRLAALRRRAEEALVADGVERTHVGYDVLVKLKVDELLEREDDGCSASPNAGHAPPPDLQP